MRSISPTVSFLPPNLLKDINPISVAKKTSRAIGSKEAEQIAELCRSGWYLAEIADVTGRTAKQIETVLWNDGLETRSHKYERSEVLEWVKMYEGGYDGIPMSFAAIARETGYCAGTIQLAVLRAGVRDRHPAESRRLAAERRKSMRKH